MSHVGNRQGCGISEHYILVDAKKKQHEAVIVERFNRTLKERIYRYFIHANTP